MEKWPSSRREKIQSRFAIRISEVGVPISANDFQEAMRLIVAENGGNVEASENDIREYAAKGDAVSEYLAAIGKR